MPNDDDEDMMLAIGSGIIPSKRFTPISDNFSLNIPLPKHLK
jgi:hypothetical protein